MNVSLINPPFKLEYGRFSRDQRSPAITKSGTLYYPIWLSYACGMLEKRGFQCQLIDSCAERLTVKETIDKMVSFKPGLIVINTSTPSIYADVAFAEHAKASLPNAFIILVGTHVSALPEESLRLSESIDAVARGEYDVTVCELAEALKGAGDISTVAGITFRNQKTGEIVHTSQRKLIEDLDELPFVSSVYKRHLDISNYFFAAAEYPMVMIFTGRGCPNRCFFCVYPQTMHGRRYRLRSPRNVVDEFEFIISELPQVKEVGIEDDTFTADLARAKEICELIIERQLNKKVRWWVNARVNLDYDTMLLMKKAGCRLLITGFESGDQALLNNMKKGINLTQSREFVRNAKRAGLLVHGCYMVGNPGETRKSMLETLKLAIELDTDTAQFFPLMVYPGTEAYGWAERQGLLRTKDFEQWVTREGLHNCVVDGCGITAQEFVEFCDYARRRYYLRPRYLLRKVGQVIAYPNERRRVFKAAKRFVRFLFRRGE
ncbi:MAG TPA: radical SAM protein [Syntrophothermus lipocalidus]|nr:radical SAM protein [Syntrophothermus lipocalidus]